MWEELNLPECQSVNIEKAVYADSELPKMQFDITKLIVEHNDAVGKDKVLLKSL